MIINVERGAMDMPDIKELFRQFYKEYNNFVTDFRYLNAINNSDKVIIIGERKSMSMLKMRAGYMIDNISRIIAVCD